MYGEGSIVATLIQCINEGQAANTLPEELAVELGGSLDKFIAKYIREGLDPSAARRMAQQDVIDAKMSELALRRRQKALQIIKVKEAIDAAEAHPKSFRRGIVSIITKDLQDILRISKATVWNWVKLNTFPSPIKLGKGITVWKKSDIDAWVKTKN